MAHSPTDNGPSGGVSKSPAGAQAWSRVAPTYAITFARFTSLAIAPLLDDARVRAGTAVLDLACGPGLAAAAALDRGARVCGADFSASMVRLARAAAPGAQFAQADAHQLPFRPGSLDAVVSNFGIHTFADSDRAFREAWRVLRQGGCFAFTIWDAVERSEVERLLELAVRSSSDHPPAAPKPSEFADAARAASALETAGFSRPRARALELRLRAADGQEIFEIFRTGTIRVAAWLAELSPVERTAVREEFVRLLAPWTGANGVEVPMRAILHTAERP
jgi:ubiquinone/menaquinone biosynthesis C-methylase UbiE